MVVSGQMVGARVELCGLQSGRATLLNGKQATVIGWAQVAALSQQQQQQQRRRQPPLPLPPQPELTQPQRIKVNIDGESRYARIKPANLIFLSY